MVSELTLQTRVRHNFFLGYAILAPTSAICSLMLMFTVLIALSMEKIHVKRHHMINIFWMSFCDLGFSLRCCIQFISYTPQKGSLFCWMSAIGGVFFVLAIQSWYFIISLQIFVQIWYKTTPKWMSKRYLFHIYAWSIALVASIIPFRTYGLHNDTGTCWIIGITAYRLVVFIPSTIYLVFAIILLCLMCYIVHSKLQGRHQKTLAKTGFFVGVFVITWAPTLVSTWLKIISFTPPEWIQYVTSLSACSSGILNFIVWICCFPDLGKRFMAHRKRGQMVYQWKKEIEEERRKKIEKDETYMQASINSPLVDGRMCDWEAKELPRPSDYTANYLLDHDQYRYSISTNGGLPSLVKCATDSNIESIH